MTPRAIKYLETGDEALKKKLTTEELKFCGNQKAVKRGKIEDKDDAPLEEPKPKAKKAKK